MQDFSGFKPKSTIMIVFEFQSAFQELMSQLLERTNTQTGETEMWWSPYLQLDETSITFQGKPFLF